MFIWGPQGQVAIGFGDAALPQYCQNNTFSPFILWWKFQAFLGWNYTFWCKPTLSKENSGYLENLNKYLKITITQLIVLLFFDFATVRWLHGFEELAIPATIQSWPRCNCGNNILIVRIYRLSWILKRRAQIIWKRKKRMRMRRNPFSRRPLTILTGTIAAQFQPVWETVISFFEQMNSKWSRHCKLMKQALLT